MLVPKNEQRLQSDTAWFKTILGVRDLTSCHTPLGKQRANKIGIHMVGTTPTATDSQHAVFGGVKKGALLIRMQRARLHLLPVRRETGLVIQQIE